MILLEAYINKNMKVLRKRLSGVVSNISDRDDIIQEACLAILKANPDLTEEDLPKYFTRVLFTKVAHYKNSQEDATVLAGWVHREIDLVHNPEKELMRKENAGIIPNMIEDRGGSRKMKDALHLIYTGNCTPTYAAKVVGSNRAAVDVAVNRFKKNVFGSFEGMRV